MLLIGLMSWLACQPPFSQFAIKKNFDLLTNYSFLSVNPCGSGGAESHLLQRWACQLWPGLANRYIPFSWAWLRIWHVTKSRQWDTFWDFFWNFWGRGDLLLLVHLSLLASLLAGGYLVSYGHNFPRVRPAQRNAGPYRLPMHHLNNWVQLKQIDP